MRLGALFERDERAVGYEQEGGKEQCHTIRLQVAERMNQAMADVAQDIVGTRRCPTVPPQEASHVDTQAAQPHDAHHADPTPKATYIVSHDLVHHVQGDHGQKQPAHTNDISRPMSYHSGTSGR